MCKQLLLIKSETSQHTSTASVCREPRVVVSAIFGIPLIMALLILCPLIPRPTLPTVQNGHLFETLREMRHCLPKVRLLLLIVDHLDLLKVTIGKITRRTSSINGWQKTLLALIEKIG